MTVRLGNETKLCQSNLLTLLFINAWEIQTPGLLRQREKKTIRLGQKAKQDRKES